MTPQETGRKLIAEKLMGWKYVGGFQFNEDDIYQGMVTTWYPDLSLDQIWQAEEKMTEEQSMLYEEFLWQLIPIEHKKNSTVNWLFRHATSQQCFSAMVKMLVAKLRK
jgi:hypothetical protein